DQWVTNRWPMFFPWGTFIINLSGSFILGFFMAFAEQRPWVSRETRLLFAVGFVGAYTTFSTYAYQSLRLAQNGQMALAALYIIASVMLGLIAVFAGFALGNSM
ncbi:MAG: fluoride efflux transporter CrcB, partial [Candidatus Binataceae bacterium]